ncbi:hypothetical protein HHI36_005426 [Cryptolaemus montrouzieri]|uniref:Mitochondrial inner membrane protein Mpv17 n=1 Tax=Cryptolaemus montrouzieri TaxID=559131 RepID=A0ABD2NU30_9CUCU
MILKVFNLYNRFLQKFPMCMQCLQTGILVGTGDALCQSIIEDTSILDFNLRRASEFFSIGTFVIGPPKVLWLRSLATYIKGQNGISVVIKKVILDQLIFAPFGLILFLVSLGIVQGKHPTEIKQVLRDDYAEILIANYKVWPAIQLVNFYLIPLQHQVLFIQTIAIIWNTYLSWKTHSEKRSVR